MHYIADRAACLCTLLCILRLRLHVTMHWSNKSWSSAMSSSGYSVLRHDPDTKQRLFYEITTGASLFPAPTLQALFLPAQLKVERSM